MQIAGIRWFAVAVPLFGPLDHGLGRTHLGLANGAGRLQIHDDADLHVDRWQPLPAGSSTRPGHVVVRCA